MTSLPGVKKNNMAAKYILLVFKIPLYRPFPHSSRVSKHEEMRSRLGWTISYKSLYFVHPNLELMPLFTGMRERSIDMIFLSDVSCIK